MEKSGMMVMDTEELKKSNEGISLGLSVDGTHIAFSIGNMELKAFGENRHIVALPLDAAISVSLGLMKVITEASNILSEGEPKGHRGH